MQSYNKILIIQTAFIGDVILATPLIETLYHNFPNAEIHFCLRKGNESLLNQHPFLKKTLIWDKQQGKLKNLMGLLKTIRLEKYDLVVNVQRFLSSGILAGFSGAKKIIGFDKNPLSFLFTHKIKHQIGNHLHETERNIALIKSFCTELKTLPKLHIEHVSKDKIAAFCVEDFICIAPASVWFTKQFPIKQWSEFLQSIPDEKVYIIGAPSDKKIASDIICDSVHPNTISLCGQLNLLESAALMQKAKMNFVNDSAPMHLASSVNAPVTAIFCSTVPEFGFGPLSDNSKIVEVQEKLTCRPCGLHGKKSCPENHFSCAKNITSQQLIQCMPN